MYSVSDAQRIALLRQFSALGHAIGMIAALDLGQLRQVAVTHISTIAGSAQQLTPVREPTPWRVAVVGVALAHRLQHQSLLHRLGRASDLSGPFDCVAQVVQVAVAH